MIRELNVMMDHIEDHLKEDMTSLDIEGLVNIPDYHFKTVFYYLTGLSLVEYIRKRKLAQAYDDLANGARVTDIAYAYGYKSLDGFTRAFKREFDILPSEVFKSEIRISLPKMSFNITVEGGKTMEYKIVEKAEFYIAGVSKRVKLQFEGVNNEIVELAMSISEDQRAEMRRIINVDPLEIVNASYNSDSSFMKEEGYLTHMIGVLTDHEDIGEGLDKLYVKPSLWAVFPNEGPFPMTMQNTMAEVYSKWLPSSGYILEDQATFSFTRMDAEKENFAYSEIWIAVKK